MMNTTVNRKLSEHLTDEEFVGFVLEDLPEELEEQIDRHLDYCVTCAKRLEDFYTAQEAFPAQDWAAQREEFIASLLSDVLGPPPIWRRLPQWVVEALQQIEQRLRAAFSPALSQQEMALAALTQAEAQELWHYSSEDGRSRAHIVREANGDLTFRLAFQDWALQGRRIRLQYSSSGRILEREAVLDRLSETEVGARIEIPAYERPEANSDISIDFVE